MLNSDNELLLVENKLKNISLDDFPPLLVSPRAQETDRHGSHLALSSKEDQCSFSTVYPPLNSLRQ